MDNYSFDEAIVLVAGIPITGFDEGDDVIQIDRNEDTFDVKVGADGDDVAAKNANKSGTFVLRLLATSPSNAFLSAQFNLMEANFLPFVPVIVTDSRTKIPLGTTLAAVIARPAPVSKGVAVPTREWTLKAGKLVIV